MMLEGRMEEVKTIIMIEGHSIPSIFPPYKGRDMAPFVPSATPVPGLFQDLFWVEAEG